MKLSVDKRDLLNVIGRAQNIVGKAQHDADFSQRFAGGEG